MKTTLKLGMLLSTLLVSTTASAFSTGVHFTITERALQRSGFDGASITHVVAANYTIDEFSVTPDFAMLAGGDAQKSKNVAHFFHYDSLTTPLYVDRELTWHSLAMTKVLADAKRANDPRAILNVIGIESHAIQDFYSHSNWADIDWANWTGRRISTLEDVPREVWTSPLLTAIGAKSTDFKGLLTGMPSSPPYNIEGGTAKWPSHGNSDLDCPANTGQMVCGLNHDAPRRRNALAAMMIAQEATYDLVQRIKGLVNDAGLWARVSHNTIDPAGANAMARRAQAMSMAGGQWGFPHPPVDAQIAISDQTNNCTINGCNGFISAWQSTLFAMFLVAPPAQATGGSAPAFPPNGTPIFNFPTATATNAIPYVGTYDFIWGPKKGVMDINQVGAAVIATISLEGKTYKGSITQRGANPPLDISASEGTTSSAPAITGQLFPVGPQTLERQVAGFMRDATRGVPDGISMTRRRIQNQQLPGNLPATKK